MITLKTPVFQLTQVGRTTAVKLKKLGIETAEDLIFYYPFRYDDYSKITSISDLQPGMRTTVKGKIKIIKSWRSPVKKRIITEAIVEDDSGSIKVLWFNQKYLKQTLSPGDLVYLAGLAEYEHGNLQLTSPAYEKFSAYVRERGTSHTARLVPIYYLTQGLSNKQLRFLIKQALMALPQLKEWLPLEIKHQYRLPDLQFTLRQIHFPDTKEKAELAKNRLKFEELFLFQMQAFMAKKDLEKCQAHKVNFQEQPTKEFVNFLPFKLTKAQKKSAWEIIKDLEHDHPMNRLLDGDVGSGKTVVSALAMLSVVLSGCQVAYMAPTEILATQQFAGLGKLFKKYDFKIAILTRTKAMLGGQTVEEVEPRQLKSMIKKGEVDIVVGTHSLIQEKMQFNKLALVIVDEQHRFGVRQRKLLKEKGSPSTPPRLARSTRSLGVRSGSSSVEQNYIPHLLSMTATPIPRSLALTVYGDLDLSIIDELPAGRKKIVSKIVEPHQRLKAYKFMREEIEKGRQVFVICPLIDPSDKLGVKSVKTEHAKLDKEVFPDLKIGLVHGKLKPQVREKVMQDFKDNQINILVATSVIEVGIDIPNATIMMIEGAERFGLAQLHQFRGRVGRSEYQSYCFLFTESTTEKTIQRLQALVVSENGFELAEKDLELRGPGEMYGTSQSGFPELKIASLFDYQIAKEAKDAIKMLFKKDPSLGQWPLLRERIGEYVRKVHLE